MVGDKIWFDLLYFEFVLLGFKAFRFDNPQSDRVRIGHSFRLWGYEEEEEISEGWTIAYPIDDPLQIKVQWEGG